MYELRCRLRAETSSAQGKPRVYFTCHPDDFGLYFDGICADIFKTQNCAVYYDPDLTAPREREDVDVMLSGMQLFVMPITSRFLYTENRGLDEFRYAIAHHIPVLPLMQESGLDYDFNRICGDLQFLDKHAKDTTAIPFSQKLKNFLDAVLIGDELAEKIRGAFDAYIFLSYRKKDRKYAQELMRLIHQNEFCRDIAIWYDEFLVPGENFNDAIGDAMKKSKLFALVVTPNLVNEKNYVMSVEYPEAQKRAMPILPAEMLETERDALHKSYTDIPRPVDPYGGAELSDSLLDWLRSIAIAENDNDARHLFFIGLAYLGGVDVEVDKEKALDLLTRSADMGLPEAMEKLITMYRTGEGVPRDYEIALTWQKRLTEARRQIFDSDPTEDHFYDLTAAWSAVGDALTDLLHPKEARAVFFELLDFCIKQNEISDCRRSISVWNERLGSLYADEGDLKNAKKHLEAAFALQKILAEEDPCDINYRNLGSSYSKLGDIALREGDLETAMSYYDEDIEISKILSEDGEVETRRGLAIAYERLGNLAQAQNDMDTASRHYENALAIVLTIVEETGSAEARNDAMICYNDLGIVAEANGDLSLADKCFKKALELAQELARELGTDAAKMDLAISYKYIAHTEEQNGNVTLAAEHYDNAIDIAGVIAQQTGTANARYLYSVFCVDRGIISRKMGDKMLAKVCFEEAVAVREKLLEEADTLETRSRLAIAYSLAGDMAERLDDIAKAKELYEKAYTLKKAIADETGLDKDKRALSVALDELADMAKCEENFSLAKEYYEQSLAIREDIAAKTTTIQSRNDLAVIYGRLAGIAETVGDNDTARLYFQKTIAICEEIAEETGTVDAYDSVALWRCRLGILDNDMTLVREAYDLWTELAEECPDIEEFAENRDLAKEILDS